jgi:beta-lactam-binding protein with PASTA domain
MVHMQNTLHHGKKLLEGPVFGIMIGAAIFLASAALFGYISLNVVIKHGEKVTVPNVINKSVVEALDLLSASGLEMRKTGTRNSSVIPENSIISQDPLPGSVVKEGRSVSVVISLGSELVTVPNLVGKRLREARVDLNKVGLRVGRFSKIHYPEEIDAVLAQSPPPNGQVGRETPIDMLLSLGPRPREYRTPDLIGLSVEEANKIVKTMGVTVGNMVTKVDPTHPEGKILEQNPPPGSFITEGSSVFLVANALRDEASQAKRQLATFLYHVPYGFGERSVTIDVTDLDGTRTVYSELEEPGVNIKVVLAYLGECTVRVYLDGKLDTERTIR